jgi:hypothetical protein
MSGIRGSAPGERRGGRQKGTPNKVNADLKEMILGALSDVGGRDYLALRAKDTPAAFLTLIGKVLPMQITGDGGGPVFVITGVDRDDDSSNSNETGFGSNDASEASIKD